MAKAAVELVQAGDRAARVFGWADRGDQRRRWRAMADFRGNFADARIAVDCAERRAELAVRGAGIVRL